MLKGLCQVRDNRLRIDIVQNKNTRKPASGDRSGAVLCFVERGR